MLLRAYELWRELERRSGENLMIQAGGLMMGPPGSEVVEGSLRSAREHGLAHELLNAREVRRRYPVFRIPDDTVALLEKAAGVVYCEQAVRVHLDAAAKEGAALQFNEPVLSWSAASDGDAVTVTTEKAVYTADQFIVSPGPWAPGLLSDIGVSMAVERQVMLWFQPTEPIDHFQPDRFPIFIWQHSSGFTPYGVPALNDVPNSVRVAFYRKPIEETCTPESVDRKIREDDIGTMRQVVRDFLPALDGNLLHGKTCLYTSTPDHHFLVGNHPKHPQVKVAAGFSGHGFKFCPVVGEIVADLVMLGHTRHDTGLFDTAHSPAGNNENLR
jgi:sarcosine oxidase